jgi:hypothetical protein
MTRMNRARRRDDGLQAQDAASVEDRDEDMQKEERNSGGRTALQAIHFQPRPESLASGVRT